MIILAFETSHDDTSISICEFSENKEPIIHFLKTWTQSNYFAKFGGTIPEMASRMHSENILKLVIEAKENFDFKKINKIAYTEKPGLLGSLHIGFLVAKAISQSLELELIPVNHLDGHFFAGEFVKKYEYPTLGIIVSGGHSQILFANSKNDIKILGQTQDDAIGELFDKISTKLQLGFPGGPVIDKLCKDNIDFNRIKINTVHTDSKYDLSFSGNKSQVINLANQNKYDKIDLACSLQEKAFEQLFNKVKLALNDYDVKTLIIGGGVAANSYLRNNVKTLHNNVIIPPIYLSTDNAAMIAIAAYKKLGDNE
ncbi:N6-L-threonylcarbamoyladenine synthase [Mycoplasma testudineum]|uniref:N(6)-L-threonylcarbamoyladenine synthase n=1 Tax=Mycoplasma testudineum TaxID=244584 RepID=A0A4R6IBX4_9MOLU|nr:tRNA (adenosine(37)-N6)-threonylcarbamoyltransferase complex transferase subunit TsaD [Mycoplasma testudineum]OYD26469.1 tRNA (adenosine(37)-N6)-threonylcarbamoyltransferase complex transferase subunit TsaD [Mycoplasma testudineum]TDO18968.1 N6-L-threonylcarbamoyladenine synthase [Mycoplasma testudineum]